MDLSINNKYELIKKCAQVSLAPTIVFVLIFVLTF
jgi:hypothetical protein